MCNWSSICLSPVCLLLMGQGWELLSATSEGSGNILQFITGKILFILMNYFHCRWRRFSRKHTQDQIKSSRKKLSKLLQLIFQKGWRTFVPSTMLPVWKVRKIVFHPMRTQECTPKVQFAYFTIVPLNILVVLPWIQLFHLVEPCLKKCIIFERKSISLLPPF